ncbi:MAG TPA: hypothetical protein VFI24_10575 [Pyrinomonadaceae bacterium]|nr:hypothetical protein [Pyrinomonadaceae bacterium]
MRALSAAELLDFWEHGFAQSPAERALTLLKAACPELSADSIAKLTVGERDLRLLTLREWTFGSQLLCIAMCTSCGEQLELSFRGSELFAPEETELAGSFLLPVGEFEVTFRLPNSFDLVALSRLSDVGSGRKLLLERCISSAECHGEEVAVGELPASVLDAVVSRMGELDKSGDVQLSLNCPQCSQASQPIFDIESFFWREISAWANRILREVHALASAYGWRETDILGMSTWRRQVYLNLIGS